MRQLLLDIAPKPEQAISMAMFNGQLITNVAEEFSQIYTDSGKLMWEVVSYHILTIAAGTEINQDACTHHNSVPDLDEINLRMCSWLILNWLREWVWCSVGYLEMLANKNRKQMH